MNLEEYKRRQKHALRATNERRLYLLRNLKEIDGSLIRNLEILRNAMMEEHAKYKKEQTTFSASKILTIAAGVAGALVFRTNAHTVMSLSNAFYSSLDAAQRFNELSNDQKNGSFLVSLETYARDHDLGAQELKNTMIKLDSIYEAIALAKNKSAIHGPSLAIGLASHVSVAAYGIAEDSNWLPAAYGDRVLWGVVALNILHGITALIQSIKELKSIGDIHPLIKTVDDFIARLSKELEQINEKIDNFDASVEAL